MKKSMGITAVIIGLIGGILMGVSLVFSTATYSVFEVNKLVIFKIGTSLLGILYAYDYLIGSRRLFFGPGNHIWFNATLFGVWISHGLSTIFSKNVWLSVYGSYDRWEGLITVSYYLLFAYIVSTIRWRGNVSAIVWIIIFSGIASSLYGIVQSLGVDIIHWSRDPSDRVFGSINNPSHYCALMGMILPVIIGKLYDIIHSHGHRHAIIPWHIGCMIGYYALITLFIAVIPPLSSFKGILFYVSLLALPFVVYSVMIAMAKSSRIIVTHQFNMVFNGFIFIAYALFLSYSRATWVGLSAALGLMFTVGWLTQQSNLSTRSFITAAGGCVLLTIAAYLFILFRLGTLSLPIMGLSWMILTVACALILTAYWVKSSTMIGHGIAVSVFILSQLMDHDWWAPGLFVVSLIGIIGLCKNNPRSGVPFQLIGMIFLLMTIHTTPLSWLNIGLFFALLVTIGGIEHMKRRAYSEPRDAFIPWKIAVILGLIMVLILPSIYVDLHQRFTSSNLNSGSTLIASANEKIKSYHRIALNGSARTSMWKSAIPWIKDHLIFGTGLDTIHYYYPKYRRSDYGKLEGGHQYTPDRLHNEYLNTLATRGLFGGVMYYIFFIGGGILIVVKKQRRMPSENGHIIFGLMAGTLTYLGQAMFSFGIVPTWVFFYGFMGLMISWPSPHDEHTQ